MYNQYIFIIYDILDFFKKSNLKNFKQILAIFILN